MLYTCVQSQLGGLITTGGGFSSYYPRPSWQDTAVSSYFTSLGSNQPYPGYNAGGRGYPDVSLLGVNYEVFIGGNKTLVFGTSASTPVFAAMSKSLYHLLLTSLKLIFH